MQRKRRDPPHRSRLRVRHVVGPAASVPLPVDPSSLVAKTALIPPPMGGSPRRFTSPLWGMCQPETSTMVSSTWGAAAHVTLQGDGLESRGRLPFGPAEELDF